VTLPAGNARLILPTLIREIGKLVRFLCSEDASYITGTDILIDGGWTAQ